MSRHHKFPRLAPERDYLIIETRALQCELGLFLQQLSRTKGMTATGIAIVNAMHQHVSKGTFESLPEVAERARQHAWRTMHGPSADEGAMLLMLGAHLINFQRALAKNPADYDRGLRPEDLR